MKIVINSCYGGFGLSVKAMKQAILENAPWIEVCTEEEYGTASTYLGHAKDVGDGYKTFFVEDVLYKDGKVYAKKIGNEFARSDPTLVRLVEEMGTEANGQHAHLRIVEIPDGVDWEISDYDGWETIEERHRRWE